MTESAVDHQAREMIRQLEQGMSELQRQQAVTSSVLKGVVETQARFLNRMDAGEAATHVLEKGVLVNQTRLAMLGLVTIIVVTSIGNFIVSRIMNAFVP